MARLTALYFFNRNISLTGPRDEAFELSIIHHRNSLRVALQAISVTHLFCPIF